MERDESNDATGDYVVKVLRKRLRDKCERRDKKR